MCPSKIGACGDDCEACPRLLASRPEDPAALSRWAELWIRLGWREAGFAPEGMKCDGCASSNRCAYPELRACVTERGLVNCGECPDYPCPRLESALTRGSFEPSRLRACCSDPELAILERAYGHKRSNLDAVARARVGLAPFELIESLLWNPGAGYFLLPLHCDRLLASARYFGVALDGELVRRRLEALAARLGEASKVRVRVSSSADIAVESLPVGAGAGALKEPIRLGVSPEPVVSSDPWLRHKTSNRTIYQRARASRPECDDVLLWNEHGEITEASSSNIVLVIDGRRLTPPLSAGLLPGTFRRSLLDAGQIEERTLGVRDLEAAEGVFVINSVRRWRRCVVLASRSAVKP